MEKPKTHGTSKKRSPIARLRSLCGLSESQFSKETGLSKATIKAVSAGKRRLSAEMTESVSLGVGVSFDPSKTSTLGKMLDDNEYDHQSYNEWRNVRKFAGGRINEIQEEEATNLRVLILAAHKSDQLLLARYLLVQAMNDIAQKLHLEAGIDEIDEMLQQEGNSGSTLHELNRMQFKIGSIVLDYRSSEQTDKN